MAAATALLEERGAARLTTGEVSRRAGVSDGALFYHFNDRAGLMAAVIENGLQGLTPLSDAGGLAPGELRENLTMFADLTDKFLRNSLMVMVAAQSDASLRAGMRKYMAERDMGPHRGIGLMAEYLAAEQDLGHIKPGVNCEALSFMFYSSCFQLAVHRLFFGPDYGGELATTQDIVDTFIELAGTTNDQTDD